MSSHLLENPKLFRHLVEDLPVGIYIVDQDGLIRFWNRGAERLTGHLSHEVVGHVFEDIVRACNRRGNSLSGGHCPVTLTLSQRQPQHWTAYYLHKNGHRVAVTIRTLPILEYCSKRRMCTTRGRESRCMGVWMRAREFLRTV